MKMNTQVATLIVAVCLSLVSCFTQPDIPKVNPKKIDKEVAKLCLQDIPERYEDNYLTYKGHFKAWYLEWKDKFDVNLSESEKRYLIGYSFFEEAINCYITTSGDQGLNMTLSPTGFKSVFSTVAKNYGINDLIN